MARRLVRVGERCAGLGLHPGSGSQRPTVKHCRVVANGGDGFFLCWRVRGGVAEDNRLENNGGYGMSIGHKDSDNFVRRNTIVGNKRGGVYWRAETEPMAAHRVTFEQNTVRDNEGWGLFVDGATHGTIIRNNAIEDSGTGRQKTGIRMGKNAGGVVLEGNTLKAERPVLDERPGHWSSRIAALRHAQRPFSRADFQTQWVGGTSSASPSNLQGFLRRRGRRGTRPGQSFRGSKRELA